MSARYDNPTEWPVDLVSQADNTMESWAGVVSFTMQASWGSHCLEAEKPLRDSAFIKWISSISDERLEVLVARFLSDKWVGD